jgi:hypothetical protein
MKVTKAIPRMTIFILLATLGISCTAGEIATKKAEKPLSLKSVGEFIISLKEPHLTTFGRDKLLKDFSKNFGRVYEGEIEVWDVREDSENGIEVVYKDKSPIKMIFKVDATLDKLVESLNKNDRIIIRAKLTNLSGEFRDSYSNIEVAVFDNAVILQVVSSKGIKQHEKGRFQNEGNHLKIVGEFLISLAEPHLTTFKKDKLLKDFSKNLGRVYEGEIKVVDVTEDSENGIEIFYYDEGPIKMIFKVDAAVDRKLVEILKRNDRIIIRAKLCEFSVHDVDVAIFDNAVIREVVSSKRRQ